MRLWSLHPGYLDSKGLVALWREALLAKHVLMGKTKGYTHHPQLDRFRKSDDPAGSIDYYLFTVYEEAERRGYRFNLQKIDLFENPPKKINVTRGQLEFEVSHLTRKLSIRDITRYNELNGKINIMPHPLFNVVEGDLEDWEKRQ